jgi:hypothetical protein
MMSTTESWKLVWFPPNIAQKSKTFNSMEAVESYLRSQAEDYEAPYPAGDWNPILTHILTSVIETTAIVPIVCRQHATREEKMRGQDYRAGQRAERKAND